MELHKIYNPITATPFKSTKEYMEFEPSAVLKPYIRCFWGTKQAIQQEAKNDCTMGIVTPDTCMDITYKVDFTNNRISNCFCGMDDRTFISSNSSKKSSTIFLFGIRFYAWGVPMFAEEAMRDTKNAFFDVEYHFSRIKRAIEPILFEVNDMYQLIPKVEKVLLENYNEKHKNKNVLQAIYHILHNKGKIQVSELRQELHMSERQLERLFREYVGVTPKSMASMVRYQYLWNDIVHNRKFDVLDAVCKYGYSDQAHLCHDFKKYHSMNINEAISYALKDVGNIQEKSVNI